MYRGRISCVCTGNEWGNISFIATCFMSWPVQRSSVRVAFIYTAVNDTLKAQLMNNNRGSHSIPAT